MPASCSRGVGIFLIGRWAAKVFRGWLEKGMLKAKVDAVLVAFTSNLVYAALMIFVVLAALGQIGVKTTSFMGTVSISAARHTRLQARRRRAPARISRTCRIETAFYRAPYG